ncbi:MAG: prolipoprotein diacylglyceryl transferase, partial [Bdellovibrionales bacterium]
MQVGLADRRNCAYDGGMALEFPHIDPVAFSIGPVPFIDLVFPIRWYALAYLAGFLLGWRYALYLAGLDPLRKPDRVIVDDFLTWVVAGVIVGGRLGYVLFYNFDYYAANPVDILKLWHGGMSFHGGALGVVAALVIYPMIKGFHPLRLADIVCAAVPIGLFFGRIANFINGELFGRAGDVPWAMVFPRGGDVPRHPSQLYEAGLEGFVLFFLLFFMMRSDRVRNRPGLVSGAFLAGYGCFRAFV